ncbi:hypothetical protein GCM10022240_13060 [Microbacterium kribbense]|uniref:Glycosyl/glycerophosphate transferase n=1 Tax=Microbacterium kribbense TaxID=433645 RepID=A0ABP7GE26_9MICO
MASFSFGAGNAAKLLRIPLYAAGRLATILIPRSRDEWVFGCGAGVGDGALALWHEVAAHGHQTVWLAGSPRELSDCAARGIPTVAKHSVRGFWRTARARVVVITHGFGDVNRYATGGAFIAQLWHGIPLKRIGIDSPETVRVPDGLRRMPGAGLVRRMIGMLYRATTRRIDLIPAASPLVRGRLESAFSLPESHVPVTGEPRVDVLSQGTVDTRAAHARRLLTDAVGPTGSAALILYAPTWRDGAADPAVPSADEWAQIIEVLDRRDAVLLVRSHPLGAGAYLPPAPTDRVRSVGSDTIVDITPALPGVQVLITDYSSLAFDSALVPLPVVYLAPDLDAYALRRGLYGRYQDVAGTDWESDWGGVVAQLDALLGGPDAAARAVRTARAAALSARMHAFDDGGNTTRVYRAIRARLEPGTAHRRRR